MKKVLLYTASLLFLACFVSGEFEEIDYQTVKFNDFIVQYAVVETIDDNIGYRSYCTDCSAYITLTDEFGRLVVVNKSMTELNTGRFGYQALDSELDIDTVYNMEVLTKSVEFGDGIVYSILKTANFSDYGNDVLNIDNVKIYDALIKGDVVEESKIVAQFYRYVTGNNIFTGEETKETIVDDIQDVLSSVYSFTTNAAKLIVNFFDITLDLLDSLDRFLHDFVDERTRSAAISRGLTYWFEVLEDVFKFFTLPLVVLEFVIIGRCITLKNPIEKYFSLHIKWYTDLLKILAIILNMAFTAINTIANIVIGIATAVIPW